MKTLNGFLFWIVDLYIKVGSFFQKHVLTWNFRASNISYNNYAILISDDIIAYERNLLRTMVVCLPAAVSRGDVSGIYYLVISSAAAALPNIELEVLLFREIHYPNESRYLIKNMNAADQLDVKKDLRYHDATLSLMKREHEAIQQSWYLRNKDGGKINAAIVDFENYLIKLKTIRTEHFD